MLTNVSNLVGRAICRTICASSKIKRPLCASLADRLCADITCRLQAACVGRIYVYKTNVKIKYYPSYKCNVTNVIHLLYLKRNQRLQLHTLTCKHHLQLRDGEMVWTAFMCLLRKPQLVYALSQKGHGNGGYAGPPFILSSDKSVL